MRDGTARRTQYSGRLPEKAHIYADLAMATVDVRNYCRDICKNTHSRIVHIHVRYGLFVYF